MKHRLAIALLVLTCVWTSCAAAGGFEPPAEEMAKKRRLLLLDLKEDPTVKGFGVQAADSMRLKLRSTWLWRVMLRPELVAALATARAPLEISRYSGAGQIQEMGRRLEAHYVVYGSVGPFSSVDSIRKTKKTVSVGTGQYETKQVRRYGFAGPKEDKQVEIMKEAEVGTAVVATEARLVVNFGIFDVETGRTLLEETYEETGSFEDVEKEEILKQLTERAADKFVQRLRSTTNAADGLILL